MKENGMLPFLDNTPTTVGRNVMTHLPEPWTLVYRVNV